MTPTALSSACPRAGEIVWPSSNTAPPNVISVSVWPTPQARPWRSVCASDVWRVAKVATAAR